MEVIVLKLTKNSAHRTKITILRVRIIPWSGADSQLTILPQDLPVGRRFPLMLLLLNQHTPHVVQLWCRVLRLHTSLRRFRQGNPRRSRPDSLLANRLLVQVDVRLVNLLHSLQVPQHIPIATFVMPESITLILFVRTQQLWRALLASLDISVPVGVQILYHVQLARTNHRMVQQLACLVHRGTTIY